MYEHENVTQGMTVTFFMDVLINSDLVISNPDLSG